MNKEWEEGYEKFDQEFGTNIWKLEGEDFVPIFGDVETSINKLLAKQIDKAYKRGVKDEVDCIENAGEHGKAVQKIRTKLLSRVREEVGENEVCPCDKLDCPIRRTNQFREELIKKLEIISEE